VDAMRVSGLRPPVIGVARVAMLLAIGVAAVAGCQRRDMGRVQGRVTFEGAAVPEALVSFRLGNRPAAAGMTDADGHFVLHTFSKGDGSFTGRCRVTVVPYQDMTDPYSPLQAPGEKPRPDIPKIYRTQETTPLNAEVVSGRQNVFTFDMKQ
jgi:hypothetical protein